MPRGSAFGPKQHVTKAFFLLTTNAMQTKKTASKAEAAKNTVNADELFHTTRRVMEITDAPNISEMTRRILVAFGMLQDAWHNMYDILHSDPAAFPKQNNITGADVLDHIHALEDILGTVFHYLPL